jgi:hypothetical protein
MPGKVVNVSSYRRPPCQLELPGGFAEQVLTVD